MIILRELVDTKNGNPGEWETLDLIVKA